MTLVAWLLLALLGGEPDLAESRAAEAAAAQTVFALLNAARAERGLAPLDPDHELDALAAAHSAEMRARRVVAHDSPVTGTPEARLAAAGYPALESGENVGRAGQLAELDDALMQSPGHRANILSPRFTHVGVGVSRSRGKRGEPGQWYVTELFARKARQFDAAEWREAVCDRLQEARRRRGVAPLELDAVLDELAAEAARAGKPGLRNALATASVVGGPGLAWGTVERVGEQEQIEVADRLLDRGFQRVGIAVLKEPGARPPDVVVVVLVK